jgi:rhodanese-related sulfurtransferase
MKSIDCKSFHEVLSAGISDDITCIDVRNPDEYKEVHIAGIRNIPLPELANHAEELKKFSAIYLHCAKGGRGCKACEILAPLGLNNCINVNGGIEEWIKSGYPVKRV